MANCAFQAGGGNYVLGAGKVYFDLYDENCKLTGERYIGNTPGFSLNVSSEKLEEYSSDDPIAEKIIDVVTRIDRNASVTVNDISIENMALFLLADATINTTGVAAITDDPINEGLGVKQGYFYQIGATAALPTGLRDIDTVVVKDAVPTTFVEGTDYNVNLVLGRIEIIKGGGIVDGTIITADYNTKAVSWEQLATSALGSKTVAVRYIADNTQGANRDLYAPMCQLQPEGEFAMKSRDATQQMQYTVSFQKKGILAAVYINNRAVA